MVVGKLIDLAMVLIATQDMIFASLAGKEKGIFDIEYNLGVDEPLWISWNLDQDLSEQDPVVIDQLLTLMKEN